MNGVTDPRYATPEQRSAALRIVRQFLVSHGEMEARVRSLEPSPEMSDRACRCDRCGLAWAIFDGILAKHLEEISVSMDAWAPA